MGGGVSFFFDLVFIRMLVFLFSALLSWGSRKDGVGCYLVRAWNEDE